MLNGRSLFGNSNSSTAVIDGRSATLSALSIGVVGGVSGASQITTTQGISTGDSASSDPYPSASSGANVTLQPGIYYLDQGSLTVHGGATLSGIGVTLVFTSSTGKNCATATINGGATLNLTAPTSGPTAGIVIFGDRNMPAGTTFKFNGGASQSLTAAIYTPKAAVSFAGGSSGADLLPNFPPVIS